MATQTPQRKGSSGKESHLHGVIDPGWLPLPPKLSERSRTISTDSGVSNEVNPETPTRRLSITERFFGGRRTSASESDTALKNIPEAEANKGKESITQNDDFKKFMKRQRKILGDDEWQ